MKIREASLKDIEKIAKVHLVSWKSTYSGIVSDQYLSNLTLEKRKKGWIKTFTKPNKDESIFVAVDEGEIIGFCNGGKNRSDNKNYDGELYAIYILDEYHGKGIGTSLIKNLVSVLREKNYESLMVWVLESNPAIHFYRKLGAEDIRRRNIRIGEDSLIEVALGWKNIDDFNF